MLNVVGAGAVQDGRSAAEGPRILRGVQAAKNAGELYATADNLRGEPGPLSLDMHFHNMELAVWNERPGEKVLLGRFDPATETLIAPIKFDSKRAAFDPVHGQPQIQVLRGVDVRSMGLAAGTDLGLQRVLPDGTLHNTITVFRIGPDSDSLASSRR
jgi:hypothetical protein